MPVELNIRVDVREVVAGLRILERNLLDLAVRRALNRTINNMQRVAIREGAKWLGVPRKLVGRRFAVDIGPQGKHGLVGVRKATRIRLVASAIVRGRPFNLIRWQAREVGDGVSATAWGERRVYPRTWIGNAGRTVFLRHGKGKGAFRGVWGPGLTHALSRRDIARAVEREGEERFPDHFRSRAREVARRAGFRANF